MRAVLDYMSCLLTWSGLGPVFWFFGDEMVDELTADGCDSLGYACVSGITE